MHNSQGLTSDTPNPPRSPRGSFAGRAEQLELGAQPHTKSGPDIEAFRASLVAECDQAFQDCPATQGTNASESSVDMRSVLQELRNSFEDAGEVELESLRANLQQISNRDNVNEQVVLGQISLESAREVFGNHIPHSDLIAKMDQAKSMLGEIESRGRRASARFLSSDEERGIALDWHATQFAALTLVHKGVDTPEKLVTFLSETLRKDRNVLVMCGILGQVGYAGGMGAFLAGVGNQLGPVLLSENGTLASTLLLGMSAGSMVGYLDSLAGVLAGEFAKRWTAVKGTVNGDLAKALQTHSQPPLYVRASEAVALNFIKNFALRVAIGSLIVYGMGGMKSDTRDFMDFGFDAGGALVAGGLMSLNMLYRHDSTESREYRLLMQPNLGEVVDAANNNAQNPHSMCARFCNFAQSIAMETTAPSTLIVSGGVINMMVGTLIMTNVAVIGSYFENIRAAATPSSYDDIPPEIKMTAAEQACRALFSTVMMATMSGVATYTYAKAHQNLDGLTGTRPAGLIGFALGAGVSIATVYGVSTEVLMEQYGLAIGGATGLAVGAYSLHHYLGHHDVKAPKHKLWASLGLASITGIGAGAAISAIATHLLDSSTLEALSETENDKLMLAVAMALSGGGASAALGALISGILLYNMMHWLASESGLDANPIFSEEARQIEILELADLPPNLSDVA